MMSNLATISPIVRGLLAEPTDNPDIPYKPVILKSLTSKKAIDFAKDAKNDGKLQVHEIFGLDLGGANLVALSACETAVSKIQGGDDLVGLSRGFIYAGTPSLMATLWQGDDRSTALLVASYTARRSLPSTTTPGKP